MKERTVSSPSAVVEQMLVCRLLPFAAADGPRNMAADEVLLESAIGGTASLRFYAWSSPTLSLGYFQSQKVCRSDELWAALPFVRRPSGGGALIHHHELTYALALPADVAWQPRDKPWLCRMHEIIGVALRKCGVPPSSTHGGGCGEKQRSGEVLCFQHITPADLMIGSSKIVGSAQRRQRGALLQHGAILLAASPFAPALPGICDLTGKFVTASSLIEAITRALRDVTGWDLVSTDWTSDDQDCITAISASKYSQKHWNEKR